MLLSKETIKLLLALVIGAAVLWGYQTVINWKEGYDLSKQQAQTAKATSGIIKDGDVSSGARGEADTKGAVNRKTFEDTITEDGHNEPETASRDAGRVPDSRLRAFERRRVERERIACDRLRRSGVQCPEGSSASDPPER